MDELWFFNFFHALKLFNINFKINALSLLVCLFVFRKVKIALKEVLPKKKKKGQSKLSAFSQTQSFQQQCKVLSHKLWLLPTKDFLSKLGYSVTALEKEMDSLSRKGNFESFGYNSMGTGWEIRLEQLFSKHSLDHRNGITQEMEPG